MMKHYLSVALSTLMVAPVFAANSFNAWERLTAEASEHETPASSEQKKEKSEKKHKAHHHHHEHGRKKSAHKPTTTSTDVAPVAATQQDASETPDAEKSTPSVAPTTPATETTAASTETALVPVKPGFFATCKTKTTAVVMGGVACVTGTASFLFNTVKPSTYVNFVKAMYKGAEDASRLQLIAGHKEAVVGIVAATVASTVAYVYREKVAETAKNTYTWAKDKVNTYLA